MILTVFYRYFTLKKIVEKRYKYQLISIYRNINRDIDMRGWFISSTLTWID